MRGMQRWILITLVIVICAPFGFAQKTKIGYKKGTDFSKYKTYTWAPMDKPIARPLLHELVLGSIEGDLQSSGLNKTEKGGDLILVMAGSLGYGSNLVAGSPILSVPDSAPVSYNANLWVGGDVTWAISGTYVQQGTLVLEFVDRAKNEVVWIGTVKQNLNTDDKDKTISLVGKAIDKLLKEFPPKTSSK